MVQLTDSDQENGSSQPSPNELHLTIHHHGKPQDFRFPSHATITDLCTAITENFLIPPSNQKLMITPKFGLIKPPFRDPLMPLSSLASSRIVLIGSTPSEIAAVESSVRPGSKSNGPRYSVPPAKPISRPRNTQQARDEVIYTFTTLRPLTYLPRPERSLAFLERLRDDPGIKATMRAHRWTVPLLTEMNPAEHTTHESRTLGLNRNQGEVIELRLRIDAYDGYRDYKTIRKTLCHELAHNVYGEHGADFWRLCHEIEKEVDKADWKSRGRALTDEEFYTSSTGSSSPYNGAGDHMDHGGWTGGEYTLGVDSSDASASYPTSTRHDRMTRREILAQAAEKRMEQQRRITYDREGKGEDSSSNAKT